MNFSTRKWLIPFLFFLLYITTLQISSIKAQEKLDYTSKVPKFIFSNELSEQIKQLENNPLMIRFKESRKNLSKDPYRPIFHYVNPEGNLNDPNGLSFWRGRWHLFYQAYPPEDTRQHWGHAVSDDLIHWEDLPYAIYPNPERAVFSGSTFVEDDRVIAMYHGTTVGNMVATSSDPLLLNWEKVSGKEVISNKSETGFPLPYDVFDPCIWKKEGIYYSLSAGRSNKGPAGKPIRANYLFRSKDLVHWEYMHEFIENDRFTLIGDDGACPYFWPIGDKYILPFFSHMSGGQYFLGDYDTDRDKFVTTSHGKFNFGAVSPSGVHAPSATPDGEGGVIIIFNMNPGKRTNGWNQIMSLPRRLTLTADDELRMEPAGDIESLRYDRKTIDSMEIPANEEIILPGINGNAIEILAEIDQRDSEMIELNVLRSPNKEEYTRITFYQNKGYRAGREYGIRKKRKNISTNLISIESSYSSILPDVRTRAPETAPVHLNEGEKLKLRIFIDKSILEVFVNGKQCVAMRVYPGREDSMGVSISSRGKSAELKSLVAYQMKSIYD